MHKQGFYEKFIKRPLDFLLALIAVVLLSPVLLVTAVLVRVKLGSPVLFRQERPGRYGRIFRQEASRHESGRAAGVIQCPQGRYESCRSAAAAGPVSAAL